MTNRKVLHVMRCCAIALGLAAIQSFIAVVATAQSLDYTFNPEREAYYGDLHLHTSYSFDAYVVSKFTPDEAYKFARGESVQLLGKTLRRSTLPLDFLAVTDHSENIGVLNNLDDPKGVLSESGFGRRISTEGMSLVGKTIVQLYDGVKHLSSVADVRKETVDSISRDTWQRVIDAANKNYVPGRFTTFIGYEWTSQPGMRNLHRNVIFLGSNAPIPFSAADSARPEDLWAYLEEVRAQGHEALAIPHNSNASDGLMFDWVDSEGKPIDSAYAKQRAANEPLVEIVQQKGQSETHPGLSSNDEFSAFEIMDFERVFRVNNSSRLGGSYVRDALGRGMQISRRAGGVNPFKIGFVGASDIHSGLSESAEDAHAETLRVALESGRQLTARENAFYAGKTEQLRALLLHSQNSPGGKYEVGSAGLTGVWAEQNTRESIFAALRRREAFATSGPRLRLRFFGGWNYTSNLFKTAHWVRAAYFGGVPMGGDLPPRIRGKRAPVFAVWAVKDPNGANLDRLQIVKVWLESGEPRETVYDVALSDKRKADAKSGKARPVGNTVDLRTASYTNKIGATELSTAWQDPRFDPTVPAVYYLRVLEIPTPRYSTILSVKRGEPLPAGVAATIQERGWSSPIWYTPPATKALR